MTDTSGPAPFPVEWIEDGQGNLHVTNTAAMAALQSRIAALEAELAAARVDADRYKTVRYMNVSQFRDAFALNIRTGKPFDEIIDNLRPFKDAALERKES